MRAFADTRRKGAAAVDKDGRFAAQSFSRTSDPQAQNEVSEKSALKELKTAELATNNAVSSTAEVAPLQCGCALARDEVGRESTSTQPFFRSFFKAVIETFVFKGRRALLPRARAAESGGRRRRTPDHLLFLSAAGALPSTAAPLWKLVCALRFKSRLVLRLPSCDSFSMRFAAAPPLRTRGAGALSDQRRRPSEEALGQKPSPVSRRAKRNWVLKGTCWRRKSFSREARRS